MGKQVVHARGAGLDVHKQVVVACARTVKGRRIERETESFPTTTTGLLGDGAAWRPMAAATAANLYNFRASSSGEVFAVGADGTILRHGGLGKAPRERARRP